MGGRAHFTAPRIRDAYSALRDAYSSLSRATMARRMRCAPCEGARGMGADPRLLACALDGRRRVAAPVRCVVPSGRAHVVGLSLGGQVAIERCAAHPEVVCCTLVSGRSAQPIGALAGSLVLA
jgi:hypothetical protein